MIGAHSDPFRMLDGLYIVTKDVTDVEVSGTSCYGYEEEQTNRQLVVKLYFCKRQP